MIPFPSQVAPGLAAWAESLMQDVRTLKTPMGPTLLWNCLEADLPPAADHLYRAVWVSDLGMAAVSDGTDWLRLDTGAAI